MQTDKTRIVSHSSRSSEYSKLTGEVAEALASIGLDLLLRSLAEFNTVCAIYLLADGEDLVRDRDVEIVEELEVRRALACRNNSLRQRTRTGTTLCPVVAHDCSISASGQRLLTDELELGGCIRSEYPRLGATQDDKRKRNVRELVDGDDDLQPKLARVLNVLHEVLAALSEGLEVLLRVRLVERLARCDVRSTAVHLQCASRRDNDNGVRLQAAGAALDVAELLETHVSSKTTLRQDVPDTVGRIALLGTGELEGDPVRQDGRVAMCDVRERPSMNKDGGALHYCQQNHRRVR